MLSFTKKPPGRKNKFKRKAYRFSFGCVEFEVLAGYLIGDAKEAELNVAIWEEL